MWNSPRPGGRGSGSAADCAPAPAGAGSVAALDPLQPSQETLLQAAMAESP